MFEFGGLFITLTWSLGLWMTMRHPVSMKGLSSELRKSPSLVRDGEEEAAKTLETKHNWL